MSALLSLKRNSFTDSISVVELEPFISVVSYLIRSVSSPNTPQPVPNEFKRA
jgi:hypothetical protein